MPRKSKKQNIAVKVKSRKVLSDDLLPESQEFLASQEEERKEMKNLITLKQTDEEKSLIEKEEKTKRMVMWTGITFFMVAIVAVWALNISQVMRKANEEMAKRSGSEDFQKFGEDLNRMLQAFKQSTDQAKSLAASTTANESKLAATEIEALKDRLQIPTSTIATSTATTTATQTKKKK